MRRTNYAAIAGSAVPRRSHSSRLSDLRTPGLLGRWPLIGVWLVVLGSVAFGAMAINVQTRGPLVEADLAATRFLQTAAQYSSLWVMNVMIFGFYLGEHVIVVLGVVLALYFLYKRFWPELSMIVIAWAGEGALWLVFSDYFNRPRPEFSIPVWHKLSTPGFPSGHAFAAVMCFGFLAYVLIPKMPSLFAKAAVGLGAVLIVLYVGLSRIFVGDHYVMDVLAGYALGFAWCGLVYTLVEVISQKGMSKHGKEKQNSLR